MPLEVKKLNENVDIIKDSDRFQTLPYAMPMLLYHVPKNWKIWESACGEGQMVNHLKHFGYNVKYATDLEMGDEYNYFNLNYTDYDCEITNIPFSLQKKWVTKLIKRDKPFAILVPFKSMERFMCETTVKYKCQTIVPFDRIAFKTPFEGWYRHNEKTDLRLDEPRSCGYKQKEKFSICPKCGGKKSINSMKSSPQIKTMWFTRYLNLPETMNLYDFKQDKEYYELRLLPTL